MSKKIETKPSIIALCTPSRSFDFSYTQYKMNSNDAMVICRKCGTKYDYFDTFGECPTCVPSVPPVLPTPTVVPKTPTVAATPTGKPTSQFNSDAAAFVPKKQAGQTPTKQSTPPLNNLNKTVTHTPAHRRPAAPPNHSKAPVNAAPPSLLAKATMVGSLATCNPTAKNTYGIFHANVRCNICGSTYDAALSRLIYKDEKCMYRDWHEYRHASMSQNPALPPQQNKTPDRTGSAANKQKPRPDSRKVNKSDANQTANTPAAVKKVVQDQTPKVRPDANQTVDSSAVVQTNANQTVDLSDVSFDAYQANTNLFDKPPASLGDWFEYVPEDDQTNDANDDANDTDDAESDTESDTDPNTV